MSRALKQPLLLLAGLLCPFAGLAQTIAPASYTIGQQTQPPPALRATANLVIVDVTVRDSAGHPIHSLRPEDFLMLEGKVPQHILNFEEHTSAEIVPSSEARPVLPPGVFTNISAIPAKGPLNILLFDKFNTEPHDQANLRQQMLKFIDDAKPGTRIAIFELGQHLKILQGFTEDRELLKAALRDKNPTLLAPFSANSDLIDNAAPPCVDTSGHNFCNSDTGPATGDVPGPCPQSSVKSRSCFAGCTNSPATATVCLGLHQRSLAMLTTMKFLTLYLGNLPGRKNLLWFSGSFPFALFPSQVEGIGLPTVQEFRTALDTFRAVQVAIYPIGIYSPRNVSLMWALGPPTDDMNELARQTGGRAFNNPASIAQDTATAIEDGSNYYTLAYAPANSDWNGSYRNIEVKLTNGRTANLSYRRGYYANDPTKPVKTALFGSPQPAKEVRPDAMHMALMLGVPEASEVAFVTRVLPSAAKADDVLAPGNEGSKGLKGPYQRYTLRLAVDVHTLRLLASSDSMRHASLEFVAFVYDSTGNVINAVGRPVKADLPSGVEEGELRNGLPVELLVSVPIKGDYTLRVAVHDLNSDHVGALEIPVSAVRTLAAK